MWDYAKAAKDRLAELGKKDKVLIVTHHDADGITAGAIASAALSRMHIMHDVKIIPQMEETAISEIQQQAKDLSLVWFTDIGAGALSQICEIKSIITDHHEIDPRSVEAFSSNKKDTVDLDGWVEIYEELMEGIKDTVTMVNPHLVGKSGDVEISGSGVTYLVAKAVSKCQVHQ